MLRSWKLLSRRLRQAALGNYYSNNVMNSPYGEAENVPEMTLPQFLWSKSDKWRQLPALTCGISGRSYDFETSAALCRRGAVALLSNTSLKPGDRVGLLLPNVPEYLIAVHASLSAGLVVTFANPLYTAAELTRQFQSAKVRCIITIPQLVQLATAVSEKLEDYDCTINVGGDARPEHKVFGLDYLLNPSSNVELPKVLPTDVAVLPYSSGTTGIPKGVMLTHRNLIVNILQLTHPSLIRFEEPTADSQETILTVLPFFHIYGFNTILNYLTYIGMHLVCIPKFTPQDYVAALVKYRPTVLFVVPSLLLFLITHPEVTAKQLESVTKVYSGAAPLKSGLIDKFMEKIGRNNCVLSQGYGMTETSPSLMITPYTMPQSKRGSCGQLLPSTQARVIDLEDGQDVGVPHKSGELLVKGPQLMKGYLDNPKATSEAIDIDGWLHTGDVVYYDEDEYFYIVDRTKELIKVKGNQVSPTELESLILEIPGVADVAVVGVSDDKAGEIPRAYVVKKPGVEISAEQVQEFVAPKVASYKKLSGGVRFVDSIPRNPSGKILRAELQAIS
ncbi:uncharacterized protein LOC131670980 [Phymastichus coffea]|uniref:uncharacterized protein LOC131670980 n=1 Tax=Phymastichus coffea TaxID=108790 RepID=UPI00273B7979|nr:uncharacterized protein LOC131670980 [Phymastichus coffea]